MSQSWKIRLTQQAEADLLDVSVWTTENFGFQQAASYGETIVSAIEALRKTKIAIGLKAHLVKFTHRLLVDGAHLMQAFHHLVNGGECTTSIFIRTVFTASYPTSIHHSYFEKLATPSLIHVSPVCFSTTICSSSNR